MMIRHSTLYLLVVVSLLAVGPVYSAGTSQLRLSDKTYHDQRDRRWKRIRNGLECRKVDKAAGTMEVVVPDRRSVGLQLYHWRPDGSDFIDLQTVRRFEERNPPASVAINLFKDRGETMVHGDWKPSSLPLIRQPGRYEIVSLSTFDEEAGEGVDFVIGACKFIVE